MPRGYWTPDFGAGPYLILGIHSEFRSYNRDSDKYSRTSHRLSAVQKSIIGRHKERSLCKIHVGIYYSDSTNDAAFEDRGTNRHSNGPAWLSRVRISDNEPTEGANDNDH